MKIVILGIGNIAHYYSSQLLAKGHYTIVQIYARNPEKGKVFSEQFNIPFVSDIEAIDQNADIYIFAVNDSAISNLAQQIHQSNALFIHCAGSQPLSILHHSNAGLIWPIYSIHPQKSLNNDSVPLIVEASNAKMIDITQNLALAISTNVTVVNFEQRKYLHLNAVLVNNFTNHLMAIAQEICLKENLKFDVLLPIIQQTINGLVSQPAIASQTGPAKRGDANTMHQHLQLLDQAPAWQQIYTAMSSSITEMYKDQ